MHETRGVLSSRLAGRRSRASTTYQPARWPAAAAAAAAAQAQRKNAARRRRERAIAGTKHAAVDAGRRAGITATSERDCRKRRLR